MLEQQTYGAHGRMHASRAHQACAAPPSPSPRQNHLLAALPAADLERLLPHLEAVWLPQGRTIHAAGDRERHLYFVTSGIVAQYYAMQDGTQAEFALTGNEGVIGVASVLGGASTPWEAEVVSVAHAYRLRECQLERNSALLRLLLRYTQALIAQIGQTAACIRHHSLEQRLCGWVLACLERLGTDRLEMTQESIAAMLGVRRESVTLAAASLQRAGVLRHTRGVITVPDRDLLERQTCECHALVRREYDRLFAPYRQAGVTS